MVDEAGYISALHRALTVYIVLHSFEIQIERYKKNNKQNIAYSLVDCFGSSITRGAPNVATAAPTENDKALQSATE